MSKVNKEVDLATEFENADLAASAGGDEIIGEKVAVIEEVPVSLMIVSDPANLPDLGEAVESGTDLVSTYWTPEANGESRRMFYVSTGLQEFQEVDKESGEMKFKSLECVYFCEVTDGVKQSVCNASKRLVGAIHGATKAFGLKPWTPVLITYLGKKQNTTNSYKSDDWSVKPLTIG